MLYRIGPMCVRCDFPLPSSYDAFRDSGYEFGSERTVPEETVVISLLSEAPDLSAATKKAEHSLMTIWETAGGWIYESTQNDQGGKLGFLTVSRNYTFVGYYCGTEEEQSRLIILQPLVQAMLECRLIYMGVSVLHAACVEKDGEGVAFSGPSMAGKSTRALQWVEQLNANWISGDRPSVDAESGLVYGVPWDGKEKIYAHVSYPLWGIFEVHRANGTCVCRMGKMKKMKFLAKQLLIPMWDTELAGKALYQMQQIIRNIPVYSLYCGIKETSAAEAYDIIFNHPEKIMGERGDNSMKLKENFEIIDLAGDYMAVPTGDNMATFGGTVVLNEISAFLLKELMVPRSEEELLARMTEEYDVDRETAEADLKEILDVFDKIGLIER